MDTTIQVQILDETIHILHSPNILGKKYESNYSPSS